MSSTGFLPVKISLNHSNLTVVNHYKGVIEVSVQPDYMVEEAATEEKSMQCINIMRIRLQRK